MTNVKTTWMVQVIYANGTFEDRYVKAETVKAAIEMVKNATPGKQRRWARFVA
jgi:hypothetical protein